MSRLVVLALISASLALLAVDPGRSAAAPAPVHDVVVGVVSDPAAETWPAYAATVERYALRTGSATPEVRVTATSSDPDARIVVNGRPATSGDPLVLAGLASGDEVNVQIADSAGTSNQSWIVLPPGFPRLTASGPHSDLAAGEVALTLGSFLGGNYTAVVDEWGVPVRAVAEQISDLKQSAADPTRYSAALPAPGGGWRIAELDEQFHELRSHQLTTAPADTTDFHDSVLLPDGGALLMGYWPVTRDGTVLTDAVIELQDAAGEATWSWNSKDHVDPAEGLVDRSAADYAHINSLQLLPGGDVLASFRNLSQVMLIAGSDGPGRDAGDVLWRFGGNRNDFTFVDDPYGGPCAQHAATLLPDGHLMVFDNGARRDESGRSRRRPPTCAPRPAIPPVRGWRARRAG
ncbi:aryl-sulfate sulfotransferase [Nocardioides sp. J2M5]|uniref:aryl-sulfate sulfotransferase n=1 Tax=Nocardioides palaemonis TaxID=2829810 RepID=UPI001BA8CAB0|nr:aryl-sulfate sulfotransferase [Nocardioides palaemonis]MBS2938201.1 aryl-sulfate sulfotransferase [Nocardioides palaemonis]